VIREDGFGFLRGREKGKRHFQGKPDQRKRARALFSLSLPLSPCLSLSLSLALQNVLFVFFWRWGRDGWPCVTSTAAAAAVVGVCPYSPALFFFYVLNFLILNCSIE